MSRASLDLGGGDMLTSAARRTIRGCLVLVTLMFVVGCGGEGPVSDKGSGSVDDLDDAALCDKELAPWAYDLNDTLLSWTSGMISEGEKGYLAMHDDVKTTGQELYERVDDPALATALGDLLDELDDLRSAVVSGPDDVVLIKAQSPVLELLAGVAERCLVLQAGTD